MAYPKSIQDIAERVAKEMQKEGWTSPNRKEAVSTSRVLELIDLIFENIWKELDDGKAVYIRNQMMLRKIYTSKLKNKYYVRCIEKREPHS